jgi:two-component system, chemotaxis family, CheB/CheR fusion protein
MRVLVIDHEIAAASSLAALLRNEKHQVDMAHDEKAALEKARRTHPALVFLGLGAAGMSGYELAHRLRALPGCEHVVLVAVTGSEPYDRQAAKAAGIEFRISKPVRIDQVLSVLEDVESRPPQ